MGIMVVELLERMTPSRLIFVDVHSDFIRQAFPAHLRPSFPRCP